MAEIWWKSDATLAPLHFFCTLVLDRSGDDVGLKFCSGQIGSLDFGVSLVLDPSVDPPLKEKSLFEGLCNSSTVKEYWGLIYYV